MHYNSYLTWPLNDRLYIIEGHGLSEQRRNTHTTACCDCDLDGVSTRLTHVFQVKGFVGCLIIAPLDGEGCGVDADLDGSGPVGVHLSVLMVVALKLQLQVRSVGQAKC